MFEGYRDTFLYFRSDKMALLLLGKSIPLLIILD